jgi:hypothetical protein
MYFNSKLATGKSQKPNRRLLILQEEGKFTVPQRAGEGCCYCCTSNEATCRVQQLSLKAALEVLCWKRLRQIAISTHVVLFLDTLRERNNAAVQAKAAARYVRKQEGYDFVKRRLLNSKSWSI